jgi:hypothetical protein
MNCGYCWKYSTFLLCVQHFTFFFNILISNGVSGLVCVGKATNEWWTGTDIEGRVRDILVFQDNSPVFARSNWGKPRKTSVKAVHGPAEIRSRHPPVTSQRGCRLGQLAWICCKQLRNVTYLSLILYSAVVTIRTTRFNVLKL